MKVITNTSMQGIDIPFRTGQGIKHVFLAPKEQIEVPDSWGSRVAENLVRRRMVKLAHLTDPTPTPAPVIKSPSKSFKSPKSN